MPVVYCDHQMGASRAVCWSNSSFWHFPCFSVFSDTYEKKNKSAKNKVKIDRQTNF